MKSTDKLVAYYRQWFSRAKRYNQAYEVNLTAAIRRIEEMKVDAELGKLVRQMPCGSELAHHRHGPWGFETSHAGWTGANLLRMLREALGRYDEGR